MGKSKIKYTIIVEETKEGYSAYFAEINVYTTGLTMPQLLTNLIEAYELYSE
jgi:predicted RNase H-like HicB family nuclease